MDMQRPGVENRIMMKLNNDNALDISIITYYNYYFLI
jgi:hypothetical protein